MTDQVAQPGNAHDDAEPDEQNRTRRQLSASLLMAGGTLASRLLGFVRAMLIAIVLGNGTRQVEMFSLANTVPNMIYVLLAGGVLNTVFVPQIVRAIKKHSDGGEAYTNRLLTATLVALALITVIGTLAAPLIVDVYVNQAWHAPNRQAHLDSIVVLTYLCLPQLFFYGVHVLVGQVLNARERYGPMMWAPIANNIIAIAVFLLYLLVWGTGSDTGAPFSAGQLWLLGGGSTVGIIAQAAVLFPYLKASGHRFRPRFDWRGVGLGHTAKLARWTILFVLVTQLGLIVVTRLGSGAPVDGSGAGFHAYNQAYLLWIMPHSLLTVSLTTAMLTSASERAAHDDLRGVAGESMRTMRLALAALLPTAVAFLVLGLPVTRLLFGWGEGSADAQYLGWTLMALAVGLVPFTLNYIVQRTFYALEDTRSPFLQQTIVVVLNVVLALVLVVPFDTPAWVAPGLGLAYSLAYLIGFAISFRWLHRRVPGLSGAVLFRLGVRCLVAVLPGAIIAFVVCTLLARDTSQLVRIGLVVLSSAVALGLFIGMARLLHISEVNDLVATVRRRRGGSSAPEAASTGDSDTEVPARTNDDSASGLSSIGAGPGSTGSAVKAAGASAAAGGPAMSVETDRVIADSDTSRDHGCDDIDATSPTATAGVGRVGDGEPDNGRGTVLGGRYRLEDRMEEHHDVTTWRAFDAVLSRSVVIHLLPPGDERSAEVLSSARRAATATDSRFLRVLDAVQSLDPELGSYVVCEYSPGQNLTQLLSSGPLSALEAAWVVREVADAMAGVHVSELYHLRISPDTVWITPTGNVKIGDMAIRAEFRGSPDPEPGDPAHLKRGRAAFHPRTDEAHDVADLGRLLYACLVHRWPGGHRYGLEAAPTNGADGWLTPRQVRHGVSPALDRVCDQVLSATPRQGQPLRTAGEVVNALTRVLGAADASGDLERRLQHPVPPVPPEPGEPEAPTLPPLAAYREQTSYEQGGTEAVAADGQWSPTSPTPLAHPGEQPPAPSSRRWMFGAIVLLLAILLIVVIAVVSQMRGNEPGADPTGPAASTSAGPTGEPPEPTQLEIVGGTDFDPQGGDEVENPDQVSQAFDGNPESAWTTDRYRGSAEFGGLDKDGVGIIVDLGSAKDVTQLKLALSDAGSDVEIRVPKADPESLDSPPKGSLDDWRTVARQEDAPKSWTVTPDEPVNTRYVMVVFTKLGPHDGQFRAGVNEIEAYG